MSTENKIELIPQYSYEYNKILNPELKTENDQIQNFGSLLSDKDRFLILLPLIGHNQKLIEDILGYSLIKKTDFYVVRAEKFNSFSMPLTIEYSVAPEIMFLYLLKELIKNSVTDRFIDELSQEKHILSAVEYIANNGEFGKNEISKYVINLHETASKTIENYERIELDFQNSTMKQHIEKSYEDMF